MPEKFPRLLLNFEGTDGATTWTEEAQGLTADVILGSEIDTSEYYSGSSSAKMCPVYYAPSTYVAGIQYFNIPRVHCSDLTCTWRFKYSGFTTPASGTPSFLFSIGDYNGVSGFPKISVVFTALASPSTQSTLYVEVRDRNNTKFIEYGPGYNTQAPEDEWNKGEIIISDKTITVKINDVEIVSGTATIDEPLLGDMNFNIGFQANALDANRILWVDSVDIESRTPRLLEIDGLIDSFVGIKIPMLRLDGDLFGQYRINGSLPIPLLQVDGVIEPSRVIRGSLSVPLQSVKSSISTLDVWGALDAAIPALTMEGYCGGYGDFIIPNLTISAIGTVGVVGSINKSLPALTISAHAYCDYIGVVELIIPSLSIDATGKVSPIASLNISIPAIQISASGTVGIVGNMAVELHPITFSGTAYWMGQNTMAVTIPALIFEGRCLGTIIALSLNTKNLGLTKYTNFDYNSLCVFNGQTIGAKSAGIYELSGTDDDNTAIPWKLRTPQINMGDSRLRSVWINGKITGDIKLIIEDAEGEQYEYDIEPVSEYADKVRVKVGKGLDDHYLTLEFVNEGKELCTIDSIIGEGLNL